MVGLHSSWKCVEISLQDGSVPVIGGVPLPDCNIEPAVWFKVFLTSHVANREVLLFIKQVTLATAISSYTSLILVWHSFRGFSWRKKGSYPC